MLGEAAVVIRRMSGDDSVMPFLVAAMDWRDQGAWDAQTVLDTPDVAHYATDWPREGDVGLVADDAADAVGAAWWRTFTAHDPGYGYIADDVPEIGLAVLPLARGRGLGAALLSALVDEAREHGIRGLSLSVEDGNDAARRLYERAGFSVCGRSGDSDTLVLWLD